MTNNKCTIIFFYNQWHNEENDCGVCNGRPVYTFTVSEVMSEPQWNEIWVELPEWGPFDFPLDIQVSNSLLNFLQDKQSIKAIDFQPGWNCIVVKRC